MSSGDPNFTPASKGDFAIDPRGYPKRHRMVAGRVITEELRPQFKDDVAAIDELMAGVTSSDLRGPSNGFGRHVATNYREGAAGSGDPDETIRRSRHNDYSNSDMGGDPPIDQGWQSTEDIGEMDLMGGDHDSHTREEFGDFLDDLEEDRPSTTSPNIYDEEDAFSLENYEPFTEDRRGYQPDAPTFSGRPHRQREAATDDLADELDGLFDTDSATFNRRGLR